MSYYIEPIQPPFTSCPICLTPMTKNSHKQGKQIQWLECPNYRCTFLFLDYTQIDGRFAYKLYLKRASWSLNGFTDYMSYGSIEDVMRWLRENRTV